MICADAVETDELDVCETVLEEKRDEACPVLEENRGTFKFLVFFDSCTSAI